ncbi:hypothetical protein CW708_01680 [Candidatus Bathyarchaeota archaeon]|nr:MAG: hypothetical protein CW708_01680 [Candidatus Bathyarchaeota archaeon]
MNLSPVKRLILETMWLMSKPAKAKEIAEETGLGFPSVMMHIIGLTRMGYVQTPERGYYSITEKGKRALGFPQINGKTAEKLLAYVPMDKAFHFYADVGKPLSVYATSLQDFCEKILKVDLASIEFHANRGDFENWFNGLGDIELARKVFLLKGKASGEELRRILYETVKNRCAELAALRLQ